MVDRAKKGRTPANNVGLLLSSKTGVALLLGVVVGVICVSCSAVNQPISGVQTDPVPASSVEAAVEVTLLGPEASRNVPTDAEPARVVVATARNRGEIIARKAPNLDAEAVASFQHPTPIGAPLVFQSVDGELGTDENWIAVLLPIRPNGSIGWIQVSEVELQVNPYRIEIRPDIYELAVYRDNELVLTTEVGIGTGDTPTPLGRFYIIELLETLTPDGPYGPYAFGLSGFSETLQTFAGGSGVIGIHGTNDPAALGTDVSHGCIRIDNSVVTELSTLLPLGTPVIIGSQ